MSCTQPSKTKVSIPVPPANPAPTILVGSQNNIGTRLFISDNPETVDSNTTTFTNGYATMWSDTTTGKATVRYRMFIWHLNKTGAPFKFGITVGNAGSSTYSIHNVRSAISNEANFGEIGKCAAAALVGETMDSISPTDATVAPGDLSVVKEWTVPNNTLIGGVIEFSISNQAAGAPMTYRVRSVIASNPSSNLRLNQNPVVNYFVGTGGSTHPRGSWDFADISSSATYTAATSGAGWKHYKMSAGFTSYDNIMTSENSYKIAGAPASQGPASSNKGHYGVKYNLKVSLTNTTGSTKTVKIYMAAGGTHPYTGAVLWSGEGATYKVPALAAGTGANQDAVEIASVSIANNQTINRVITVSNAGGAATPSLIAFRTM